MEAGRGLASPEGCRCWLPVWLPGLWHPSRSNEGKFRLAALSGAAFRARSFGSCVETAFGDGVPLVRDTTERDGVTWASRQTPASGLRSR
jgi:hypothetical protein